MNRMTAKTKKRFIVRKLIEKVIVFDDYFKVLFTDIISQSQRR